MGQGLKYVIFRTRWGYFGLLAGQMGLVCTALPIATSPEAKELLLAEDRGAKLDSALFFGLQEKVRAYFEGECVDFSDIQVDLDGLSRFGAKVLRACRKVEYGGTISYGRLAKLADKPKSGRAAGNILAQNPVPLIIPCHRVIRSDGSIGGFSAAGGQGLKKMMLELEQTGGK
ncbi:MAG: methylated-DNA--[protein]-cysteine S-methyltransferase [Planctomycetota bacterium]